MPSDESQRSSFDANKVKELMAEFKTLSTFAAVELWDKRAGDEVELIIRTIQQVQAEIVKQTQALENIKQEHSKKSLVGRLFSGGNQEKELIQKIEKYRQFESALGQMATQLQESIDFTPNSADEQKILIKELRQHKKELQLQKREVAAEMKAARTDARQQSAKAGAVFGVFYSSKVAASERRNIRYAKEAALRPQENAKTAIERQLIQVDRDILWAEKFN